MNALKVVFAAVCGVTFIFLAASTGGPNWYEGSGGTSFGIFRACGQDPFNKNKVICGSVDKTTSTVKAVRAFAVLSVLATVVAAILAIIGIFVEKIPPIVPTILMGVAGFCALIAGAIFADEYGDFVKLTDAVSYGWSFYLIWVGMVTAFISAALGFMVHKKK